MQIQKSTWDVLSRELTCLFLCEDKFYSLIISGNKVKFPLYTCAALVCMGREHRLPMDILCMKLKASL